MFTAESALLSFIFTQYGLGYFGQWSAFPVVMIAIASWALLSFFAWLWMKRFTQGPLERLLCTRTRT